MATFQLSTPAKNDGAEEMKLRDSCNACAVSKIKCTRTKPVCGRCAKRGYRCEYVPTRRAGRKHHPRPSWQQSLLGGDGDKGDRDGNSEGCDTNSNGVAQSTIRVRIPTPTTSTDSTSTTAATLATSNSQSAVSLDLSMTDADGGVAYPSPSNAFSDGTSASTPTLPAYEALGHISWWQLSPESLSADDLLVSPMPVSMPEMPGFPLDPLLYPHASDGARADAASLEQGVLNLGDYAVLPPAGLPVSRAHDERGREKGPDGPELPEVRWESVASALSSSLPLTLTAPLSPSRPSSSFPPSLTTSSSVSQHTPPRAVPEIRDLYSLPPSECCLIRALELLKKLFPGLPNCTCQSAATGEPVGVEHRADGSDAAVPTIQRVIAENKHTLEAVQDMLQCACLDSDGSYLLAVISLVVFKVLAWYRAVAEDQPPAEHPAAETLNKNIPDIGFVVKGGTSNKPGRRRSCYAECVLYGPAVIDGYHLDGDGSQPRMAAQLVLSELHRVQRLVNVLAGRLKSLAGNGSASVGNEPRSAFASPTWFRNLEHDLRERLRALSAEIVEMLRQ